MAKRVLEGEVVDIGTLQPVEKDGGSILSFLRGFKTFLQRADVMENDAKQLLATSKSWIQPASLDDDTALVTAVRQAKVDRTAFLEEWKVTMVLSRFHRALTAKRGTGDECYDQAIKRGEALHEGWLQAERRRIFEEDEKQRKEQERLAQEERDRDIQRMEDERLRLEQATPELSEREAAFVAMVSSNQPPTQSARMAGFKNPEQAAVRLMGMEKILTAIRLAQEKRALENQKKATAAAPLRVENTAPAERAQVATGAVYTWSAEIYDQAAFLAACLDPAARARLGIPAFDVLQIAQAAMNEQARQLHENIDRWPGVRHHKKSGIR